jgi:hypothetical protein
LEDLAVRSGLVVVDDRGRKPPRSGKLRDDPERRKGYGTPFILRLDGRDILVSAAADWLDADAPSDLPANRQGSLPRRELPRGTA